MNQIRRILAANNIRTFSIISRATRLRKSTGTVGTIMAVKITGYLELIGIGTHLVQASLFFFYRFYVSNSAKLRPQFTVQPVQRGGREREKERQILCTRCATMQGGGCSKRVGVHPSKRFSSWTSSKV